MTDSLPGRPPTDCTTTTSFSDHGVDDGADLVSATYYRLLDAGYREFEPSVELFEAVETAFVRTYLDRVDEAGGLPDHVAAAIDGARELTREEFAGRPDADLRTEVLPAFYRRVAGFHCSYRE
jgi:hypothetical protein